MGEGMSVDLRKGMRVQLHAATTYWAQGDRYGEIVRYGRMRAYMTSEGEVFARPVYVKLDKSGRTVRLHPESVFPIEGGAS